jgi:hypothetical protein
MARFIMARACGFLKRLSSIGLLDFPLAAAAEV